MAEMLSWLVLPVALFIGLGLFALFGMFIASVGWEWKRDERLADLESAHHMKSQAEVNQRMALIQQARAAGHGTQMSEAINDQLSALESLHKRQWNARVKEIVETENPCPDEWFDELDEELRARGW